MTAPGKPSETVKQPKGQPPATDPRTGRFMPGNNGGPGRPQTIDWRAVINRKCVELGISREDAIWSVYNAIFKKATEGDMTAAKLLLDRECGLLKQEHKIDGEIVPMMPQIPRGRDLVEWARKLHELAEVDEDD